jgi:hypothetical protein
MKAYAIYIKSYSNGLWDEYISEYIYSNEEEAKIDAKEFSCRFPYEEYKVREIKIHDKAFIKNIADSIKKFNKNRS